MSVIHAPKEAPLGIRELLVPSLIGLVMVGFGLRLWYVQVAAGDELRERGENTRESRVSVLAPRGRIYDRTGTLLAGVRPMLVATAIPNTLLKDEELLLRTAEVLRIPPEELKETLEKVNTPKTLPATIARDLPMDVATRVAELGDRLPGVNVETRAMRTYKDTASLAHVLGWVWVPGQREVKQFEEWGVRPPDYVGREGIEKTYERKLMGTPGVERVRVDARRRPVEKVPGDHPVPGSDLFLAIDEDLQQYARALLGSRRGAVVALDPKSGDVLAMVTSPSYDAAQFIGGISQKEMNVFLNDPGRPLYHRPTQASYQPGSTWKIVTAIAAYEAGIFDPSRTVYCGGGYRMGRQIFRCMGTHGPIAFNRAMTTSCNTYFSDLAVRVGQERLAETALRLGFGQKTGIDLPTESTGLVPSPEWWAKRYPDRNFTIGNLVNFGCGQGELSVTPLQMAQLIALVGNNGVGFQPRLVRAVRAPNTSGEPKVLEPTVAHRVTAPAEFWETLRNSLQSVVTSGTARRGQIGVTYGGKTGSAENASGPLTHSWFVAFAPIEKPQIAIAVIAENAGHGGEVAVPLAAQVMRRYLERDRRAAEARANPAPAQRSNSFSIESETPTPLDAPSRD